MLKVDWQAQKIKRSKFRKHLYEDWIPGFFFIIMDLIFRGSYLTMDLFLVLDSFTDDLVTRSSSLYVMGTAMESCILQAHHMENTSGLILFWQR